jgi:ATP-dependent RNA helicase DDX56/DBP9
VLLPSVELCEQVRQAIRSLLKYCDDTVKVASLKSDSVDAAAMRDNPDIIVATPAQLLKYCQTSATLKKGGGFMADLPSQLRHLVLDEADLVLGQGYESDLTELLNNSAYLGKNFQMSLFSATLDEQIEELKSLYMPPPVVTIKIKDPSGSALGKAKLTQLYHHVNTHQDKFFMTLCLLQTHLISASGKILVFIHTIPDAYKLKLFLEQFGVSSAVLNHELPRNSRMSILDHFNRGLIDILIATDEATGGADDEDEDVEAAASNKKTSKKRSATGALKDEEPFNNTFGPSVEVTIEETRAKKPKTGSKKKAAAAEDEAEEDEDMGVKLEEDEEEEEMGDEEAEGKAESSKLDAALAAMDSIEHAERKALRKERKASSKAAAKTFGASNVSRGVDFKDVGTVLNFDFPPTLKTYTHRCGRTARANRSGVALSFVEPAEREQLEITLAAQLEKRNGMGLEAAPGDLQPLPFDQSLLDGMRYRCNDKIRAVTTVAIREARLKEIKLELLNSERLRSHFEDNPRELALLRHDQVLRSKGIQKHLAVLPSYLLPDYLQGQQAPAAATPADNRNKLRRNKHKAKVAGANALAKKGIDGLKGFALKKAKGRHTMAMKNAGDPLRTFRAKPLNAAASSTGAAASSGRAKVDF